MGSFGKTADNASAKTSSYFRLRKLEGHTHTHTHIEKHNLHSNTDTCTVHMDHNCSICRTDNTDELITKTWTNYTNAFSSIFHFLYFRFCKIYDTFCFTLSLTTDCSYFPQILKEQSEIKASGIHDWKSRSVEVYVSPPLPFM